MENILVFDTDNSLSSIGGLKKQKEVFGIEPIPVSGGLATIHKYIGLLFEAKKTKKKHPLFGTEIINKTIDIKPKAKDVGLDAVAIDTLSTLGRQERNQLSGSGNMTRDMWGTYGENMTKLLNVIKYLPLPVIVTTHIEISKDSFTGYHHQVPLIKGSTKDDIGSFFDVVLYAEVDINKKKKQRNYKFLVKPTQTQSAKDRIGSFDDEYIDQDLKPLIKSYQEQGLQPKILICGKNGMGKSSCLASLTGNSKHVDNNTSTKKKSSKSKKKTKKKSKSKSK